MKSITLTDTIKNKSFTWYDNGTDSILRAFEGFEYAQTKNSFEDLPSNLGGFYSASKFSTRRLSFQGDLVGSSIFANRRAMLEPMSQAGLKLLTFTTYDDLDLQCEVIIDKLSFPYTHSINTFLVEAIAADWRFYSQLETSTTVSDATSLTNNGNEETFPIITIYGDCINPTITNNTTGESFTINKTLLAGESILINTKNRTVLFGATNIYSLFSGDFMVLDSGENNIGISSDSGLFSYNFTYRDAYRGI